MTWYLRSEGDARSSMGKGLLGIAPPAVEKPDTYTYDPDNPVPTVGGTSIYAHMKAGPYDQKHVEKRQDVLVYSTPPLEADLEVTGHVKVVLYASSSAVDTDFTAQLADVRPDGASINIKAAVVRARYRDSLQRPSLLVKGKVYRYEIVLGAVSNLFKKGHRVRLQVSSSNFPEFGRNLNTGEEIAGATRMIKANQAVYHDREHLSQIILPVAP